MSVSLDRYAFFLNLLLAPKVATDPDTTGWGSAQKSYTWFNLTEGRYKYWSGSAKLTFPSASSGGAPVDASYVTINAEAGLDAEIQHANITDEAQKHTPKVHILNSDRHTGEISDTQHGVRGAALHPSRVTYVETTTALSAYIPAAPEVNGEIRLVYSSHATDGGMGIFGYGNGAWKMMEMT